MSDFELDGKKYVQEWEDSEGRKPNMPPETRVTACGGKYSGVVKHQRLHYDVQESFFGNVIVAGDDGKFYDFNCWQCSALNT